MHYAIELFYLHFFSSHFTCAPKLVSLDEYSTHAFVSECFKGCITRGLIASDAYRHGKRCELAHAYL